MVVRLPAQLLATSPNLLVSQITALNPTIINRNVISLENDNHVASKRDV
jgi:hypothetical protein